MQSASPPTTNLKDVTSSDESDNVDDTCNTATDSEGVKSDVQGPTVMALAPSISPVHSSSLVSSVGEGSDDANSTVGLKEELLSESSQKLVSTSSTPTSSLSPIKQSFPPRSVTPDSKEHQVIITGAPSSTTQSLEQQKHSSDMPKQGVVSPSRVVSPQHTITGGSIKKQQISTNSFDSHSSKESITLVSSVDTRSQPKTMTGDAVNSKITTDEFAAVPLSKASVKLSESEKHMEPPLTNKENDVVMVAKAVAISEDLSKLNKSEGHDDAQKSSATGGQAPVGKGSYKKKRTCSTVSLRYNYVKKPRLDSVYLTSFFRGIVAQDKLEMLMNVTWGGCNLPSSPMCEIEVGLVSSNRAVYLLEVLDPKKHIKRPLSWMSENLPLAKIMSIPISTLSKVSIGILDQVIQVEFISKGIVKKFAMFPYSHEDVNIFVKDLVAILEASSITYMETSPHELILAPPEVEDRVMCLNPYHFYFTKLKEAIVWPKSIVQVGNYIITNESVSIDEEARCVTNDICSKFEIEHYAMVSQISIDYLPIANDKLHLKSCVLILTNDTVYLCKEDFSMHPNDTSQSFNPPFPRCIVLDSHPLVCTTNVMICERPQPVVSYTDPVYEFSISFEVVNNVPSSAKTTFEWQLCAQNKKRVEHFVSSLCRQLEVSEMSYLQITRTVDPISPHLGSIEASQPRKRSLTKPSSMKPSGYSSELSPVQPSFFHSEMLVNFARLTNFQRLKFFKKYIAQPEFMKSDEVPLSIFLSHCSTSNQDKATEVEACVLISNYAIYLLSDSENIQAWVDGEGPVSFQRRGLLSKNDAMHLQCYYRLWLTDIKEVRVGLFYLSVIITDGSKNSPCTFVIHANIPSATLSFLSALSMSVNLRDSAEELSNFPSDYMDLETESVSKQSRSLMRPSVEFIQQHDLDVNKLKQMLLESGPKISHFRSIEESAASMHIFCQQVMLLVEDICIHDYVCLKSNPHLVLLTNYGLFVCRNFNSEQLSPSVLSSSDLLVQKWYHMDSIDGVIVTSPKTSVYGEHILTIQVRLQNNLERNTLCLLIQNCELLNHFLHFLCLVWQVHNSQQLPIAWE